MSQHQFFRRTAVPAQVAQQLQTTTIPAPTRGIIQNENEAYMQPGAAVVCDNWKPTMRGVSLRGGCVVYCDLHAADVPAWQNLHFYEIGVKAKDTADNTYWISLAQQLTGAAPLTFAQYRTAVPGTWAASTADFSNWVTSHAYALGIRVKDTVDGSYWDAAVAHTSPASGTFAAARAANPTYWAAVSVTRGPVISGFEYASGNIQRMYAGQLTKLYDVTTPIPALVKAGQTSGNYSASQLANAQGDWMIVVNDAGDPPLRYGPSSGGGLTWETLSTGYVPPAGKPSMITGIPPAGLSYVCKYRNRYFFIETGSMNAWYLPLNAVGGALAMIPLSGAATKGGKLLACFTWSIDAGDGIDDKLVFMSDLGELLIFTGSDPSVATSWRQEGRYEISPPLGMNAHLAVGGDVLLATVDGIVPISGAITKSRVDLELAAITRTIKSMWREQVLDKREHPWTMCKWDEYGAIFTTFPGGATGKQLCLATNAATGAHARFTGWDAMCFIRMRGDAFFGDQLGRIIQMDRTGYDNGVPYVATLVGGWEMFQSPSQTVTWRQARASFAARAGEPFVPQLSATTDYVVVLPQPSLAGDDPGLLDLWDQGLWDSAKWDAATPAKPVVRNTGWVSIGMTGFSHAPVVQVTVAQQAKPEVDLISIAATYERDAVVV